RIGDNGVYKFPFGSADTAPVVGQLGTGVELNEVYTEFTQGPMKQTGNPFDLALNGQGFFTVQTPEGQRYTRNGTFLINKDGMLVDDQGDAVLGEKGPIFLKKNNFVVDKEGRIYQNPEFAGDPNRLVSKSENTWTNRELVDTLKIVDFPERRYLEKQGNSQWKATDNSGRPAQVDLGRATEVEQGFLEGSNVNPVTSMVNMIEVNRAYEANQKTIQTQDSLADKLINDAVKV
ncbi:MAG TPA: flagellar hook-basal body protein, partial [Spirochaetia bacterium]|nr:flagellar hook-basal body protein [Spirochaetia bacterium]